MTIVLDGGALIALERHDRSAWTRLKSALVAQRIPVTHGGVVGQAWRGRGPRQAMLARALDGIEIRPLDDALGRAAGALLAGARTKDVIDAALVLLAEDGDDILTSDTSDLAALARLAGRRVEIFAV